MPRCMPFDCRQYMLVRESVKKINGKLKVWTEALEDHGFCISRNKIEYVKCKFG